MYALLRLVLAFACCGAVPAFAISSDVYVTSVAFSGDRDTATIYLSQSVPYGTVRYDLYAGNEIRRGGGTAADGKTVIVLSGFRDDFLAEGDGEYRLGFQICQHGADRLNTTVDCSPAKFITVLFEESATNGGFTDVSSSHPNAEAIVYARTEGIVSGYPDGTYRPNNTINRAEFTKIVIGSNFTDQALDRCDPNHFYFADAQKTAWYAPYLCLAAQHQIVGGYPDGTFKPEESISFVEAAKIVATVDNFYVNGVRYNNTPSQYGILGPPLPESVDGYWYEPYVRYLADHNAIPLTIVRLDQRITRGEMAEMIYRLLSENSDKPSKTYDDLAATSEATVAFHDDYFPINFSYPARWRDEVQSDSSAPWYVYLGPTCRGCAEGSDAPTMYLRAVDRNDAANHIADIRNNSEIPSYFTTVDMDTTIDGNKVFIWSSGGICGFRTAYVIGKRFAVTVGGFCVADDAELSKVLDAVALSIRENPTFFAWQE